MVAIAQPIARRLPCSIASAMYEPTPGSAMLVWPTLMASEATTKNQLPDIDIIMFHSSAGMANGTSSRQKRIHGESRKDPQHSHSSSGTVRSDWLKLKAMFQAWLVKI